MDDILVFDTYCAGVVLSMGRGGGSLGHRIFKDTNILIFTYAYTHLKSQIFSSYILTLKSHTPSVPNCMTFWTFYTY